MSYIEEIEQEKENTAKLKEAYQMTFFSQAYGDTVLMDILNDLGYFATDAAYINPELTAAANRILMKAGVYDTSTGLQRFIDGMSKASKGEK